MKIRSIGSLAMLLALLAGCASAQRAGWQATMAAIDARDLIDRALADATTEAARACGEAHLPDTDAALQCTVDSRAFKAQLAWSKGDPKKKIPSIRAGINTSIRAGRAVLKIAGDHKDTMAALKVAFCTLRGAAYDFRDLLFAKAKELERLLSIAGLVCK